MTRKSLLAAAVAALAIASALACGGGSSSGGGTDAGSSSKNDAATTNIPADASSQQQIPPDASTQQIPADAATPNPDDGGTTIPDDASTTIPPDAGTTIDPDGGTTAVLTCGPTPTASNTLTAKVGTSTTINFSTPMLTATHDSTSMTPFTVYELTGTDSTGTTWTLDIYVDDMVKTMTGGCPASFTLPTPDTFDPVWVDMYDDNGDYDFSSDLMTSSGTFVVNSFTTSETTPSVSVTFTNASFEDYNGGPDKASFSGTFAQ